MYKLAISAIFLVALAGLAWSADIDRHASFSDAKSANAAALCKGFYGSDDNLTACSDFCTKFRSDNEGGACKCDEGKCPADESH